MENDSLFAAIFGSFGFVILLWCAFGYWYYRKYKIQLIEYKEKEGNCGVNAMCCIPVLFYASMRIYCQPLLQLLCFRCLEKICCYYCRNHKTEWYYFTDKQFPPNQQSLGMRYNRNDVEWIRANDFEAKADEEMYLFSDGIEPADVCQGALGDCWLIAALAALAEFPGSIENVFSTLEKQKNGKYVIYLYDARFKDIKNRRKKIVIDDFMPCNKRNHKPLFSKPNGNEIWVLLLEKAFAKFCGSYQALDGGQTIYVLQAMTGDHVFMLKRFGGIWSKLDVVVQEAKLKSLSKNPFDDWYLRDSKERFDDLRLWNIIKKYYESGGLITCAITSRSATREEKNECLGIVAGHAYTILRIVEFKKYDKLKLLQLRNPWGTFSWNGKWCKKSQMWQQYKDIAIKLNHDKESEDDGIFWIEYRDFVLLYNRIYICDKSTIRNLHIDVKEDEGCFGVFKGCFLGCCEFWFCCRGLRDIYCGRVSSTNTIDVNRCCVCSCCKQDGHSWTAI